VTKAKNAAPGETKKIVTTEKGGKSKGSSEKVVELLSFPASGLNSFFSLTGLALPLSIRKEKQNEAKKRSAKRARRKKKQARGAELTAASIC
jgi:hypothetical protein